MALKIRNPFYFDSSQKALNQNVGPINQNKLTLGLFDVLKGWQTGTADQKKLIEMSYRLNTDVYSVIGLITKRASQMPWTVYELKEGANRTKAKTEYEAYQKAGDTYNAIKTKAKYWVQSNNKQLNMLLENPNRIQTWPLFIQEALGYKLLTGNRYLYKLKPSGFKTTSQMFILPSHFMTVNLNEGANYLERNKVTYIIDSDFNLEFTTDEVYHSKTWNPAMTYQDFVYGYSPIESSQKLIDKSNKSYAASAYAYENMGMAGLLSQGPTTGEDGGFLTPDEASAIQKKFDKRTAGVENFKRVIATSASLNWVNMGLSPVDLAIIDSQKMDREQICNIWNVPVVMLNSQDASTRDNVITAERSFYLNAVIPEMCDFRDTLNTFIVRDFGPQYYIDFDTKSIPALQADLKILSERLTKEVEEGIITRNEYRLIMDYELIQPKNDPDQVADKLILPSKYKDKIDANVQQ